MAVTLAWGESLTVTMELGFLVRQFILDASVLDGSDLLDGTLEGVFVESYVQSLTINRGKSDQLQNYTAGTAAIVLINNDRRFDPINQDSPYWDITTSHTGVVPRRKVTITSGSVVIFTGSITDVDVVYQKAAVDVSTVTITASDDFVRLANAFTGAAQTPSAELSGARVTRILDLAAVAYSATARAISTGTATLGAYEIAANSNALTYLQACAAAEQNNCYMSADGLFTFSDRVASSFATAAVSFSDAGSDVPYTDLSVVYGQELLYNRVQCTTADIAAAVQIVNDATSETAYGISTLSLDSMLLSTDAQAATLATTLLARYKEPEYRFDEMTVMINGMSGANRAAVMALDLSATIGITRTFATGTPASVTKLFTVIGISHRITNSSHTVTFRLAVADILYALILDDPVFGLLDGSNALAA